MSFDHYGIGHDVIDVSQSIELEAEESASSEQVLNAGLEATRRPLGGVMAWGGQVSQLNDSAPLHPNSKGDSAQARLFGELERRQLLNPFGLHFRDSRGDRIATALGEGLTSLHFSRKKHELIRFDKFAQSVRKHFFPRLLSVRIDRFERDNRLSKWRIGITDDLKETFQLLYDRVFLCSGAIGNAFLLYLATGNEHFRFGDHITFRSHRLTFNRPVFSGSTFSAPSSLCKVFSTYHFAYEASPGTAYFLRIAPPFSVPGLAKRPGGRSGYNSLGAWRVLDAQFMVDTGISGELSFGAGKNRSFTYSISNKPQLATIAESLLSPAVGLLSALPNEVEAVQTNEDLLRNPSRYLQNSSASSIHIYGTIPMGSSEDPFTVNGDFEVEQLDNLFSLGNSSLPNGLLDHPTSYVAASAQYVAQRQTES